MAVMRVKTTVVKCDLCGGDNAIPVKVQVGKEDPFGLDLCDKHREPIKAWQGVGGKTTRPKKRGVSREELLPPPAKHEMVNEPQI